MQYLTYTNVPRPTADLPVKFDIWIQVGRQYDTGQLTSKDPAGLLRRLRNSARHYP